MAWVSPTGHNDPESRWSDETKARDSNTSTYASSVYSLNQWIWSDWLELTHSAIDCSKIQVYSGTLYYDDTYELEAYYGGAWHSVYEGTPGEGWHEHSLGGTYSVTKARVKVQNRYSSAHVVLFRELDFWQVPIEAPTVTTQAVTDIGFD